MSFFAELRRRNVFRVAAAYVVLSWLLLQLGDILFEALELPPWSVKMLVAVIVLGFVPVVVFSWAYELTPEGVKKESEIPAEESITTHTARKLDIAVIVLLMLAMGLFGLDRFAGGDPARESEPAIASKQSGEPAAKTDDTVTDDRKSIAVLPFDNFSEDAANAFFASGVHEDILTHLSRVAALRVISRSSVDQYANSRPPATEIAATLGVDHLVEGSVRRVGDQVRVTAQLIDARTDEHLWADSFDRQLTDVFAIQTEIAKQIVLALEATLTPREEELISRRPTDVPEAYEAYARARRIVSEPEYSLDKYDRALPLVEAAIRQDPDFALAHILISEVRANQFWITRNAERYPAESIRAPIERALELQPDLPEAEAALGQYNYRVEGDYRGALERYRSALDEMPNNVSLRLELGFTQRRLGLFDEALESFRSAQSLDPENLYAVAAEAQTLIDTRQWEPAIELLTPLVQAHPSRPDLSALLSTAHLHGRGDIERARAIISAVPPGKSVFWQRAIFEPEWYDRDFDAAHKKLDLAASVEESMFSLWFVDGNKGWLLWAEDDSDGAVGFFKGVLERLDRLEDDGYLTRATKAVALAHLGRHDEALALLDIDLAQLNAPGESGDVSVSTQLDLARTQVLMLMGRTEAAIEALRQHRQLPNGISLWSLKLSPIWDPLREEPGFQTLLEEEA